jgi:hypothetical protein
MLQKKNFVPRFMRTRVSTLSSTTNEGNIYTYKFVESCTSVCVNQFELM